MGSLAVAAPTAREQTKYWFEDSVCGRYRTTDGIDFSLRMVVTFCMIL